MNTDFGKDKFSLEEEIEKSVKVCYLLDNGDPDRELLLQHRRWLLELRDLRSDIRGTRVNVSTKKEDTVKPPEKEDKNYHIARQIFDILRDNGLVVNKAHHVLEQVKAVIGHTPLKHNGKHMGRTKPSHKCIGCGRVVCGYPAWMTDGLKCRRCGDSLVPISKLDGTS